MTLPLVDLGNTLSAALLSAASDSISANELPMPALVMQVAGSSVPTTDACAGMLWCRLATQMPTYGDGSQFSEPRSDFAVPSWLYAFELGIMSCHSVITEDGDSIDATEWTGYATRDGQYRMAIMYALTHLLPTMVRDCVGGFTIDPWTPIGPDGGYSGGIVVVRFDTQFLAA